MAVNTSQFCAWVFLVATAVGCGSEQKRNPDGDASSTLADSGKTVGTGDVSKQGSSCAPQSSSLGLAKIAGDELSVVVDGKRTSLCEALEKSGKPVAIFQFAGILCLSCQEEAEFFAKAMADQEVADKVAHIVIVTDFVEDFAEEEFAQFMTKFAPNSMRVQDEQAALWKQFSLNPAIPTRPTLFAMNQNMETFLINKEGADYKPMLEEAMALAP